MRLKKGIIALIVTILVLAMTVTCFAVTEKEEKETKTLVSSSNTVTNETKNEIKSEEKNEVAKNETVSAETKKTEATETVVSEKPSKAKVYNEDVANGDDTIEYKNVTVNGNMFLGGKKVVLDNAKVDGDIFIGAEEVEINDSTIDGNVLLGVKTVVIKNSRLKSAYIGGETIEIKEGTSVTRDLKLAGKNVVIDANVGRDVNVGAETSKFGDDAVVAGKAIVRAKENKVSKSASINNLDFEETDFNWEINIDFERNITTYLIEKGTEIAIILLIAIFVLYALPKFTEVNASLRVRDFFRAFFTGILEFILAFVIFVALLCTIYGAGYALILLNLVLLFVALGKVIFIISFAIRISCGPEKVSKVKAFFATVLVALVLAAIEMISLAGTAGVIIDGVISLILAFTGLGTLFRVLFTSKKKLEQLSAKKLGYRFVPVAPGSNQPAPVAPVAEEKKEEVKPEPTPEANNATQELQNEIKAEVKEEVEELKEEHEEEKKLEETSGENETPEEPKEEQKEEEKKTEEENKDDKKEDDKK